MSDVISEAIHRDCHRYCQTQASVPASQRVVHPRIPLPTFTRWIPLAMPSVCLAPVCHAHRLDQVIVAGMSQASAVSYSHESSSPCLVPPLWSEPSVGFCQIYIHPDIQHMGLFNELHSKCGCLVDIISQNPLIMFLKEPWLILTEHLHEKTAWILYWWHRLKLLELDLFSISILDQLSECMKQAVDTWALSLTDPLNRNNNNSILHV